MASFQSAIGVIYSIMRIEKLMNSMQSIINGNYILLLSMPIFGVISCLIGQSLCDPTSSSTSSFFLDGPTTWVTILEIVVLYILKDIASHE